MANDTKRPDAGESFGERAGVLLDGGLVLEGDITAEDKKLIASLNTEDTPPLRTMFQKFLGAGAERVPPADLEGHNKSVMENVLAEFGKAIEAETGPKQVADDEPVLAPEVKADIEAAVAKILKESKPRKADLLPKLKPQEPQL